MEYTRNSNSEQEQSAISICVTVKNRSRVRVNGRELQLFPNCVRSIADAVPGNVACELVVADWESDDWPLEEWIHEFAGRIPVTMLTVTGQFSRGRGRNAAADAARYDWLFFLDADCLICRSLIRDGLIAISQDRVFFPVLYSFSDPDHRSGWWRHKGLGNCIIRRRDFEQAGRFPEYGFWGREDVDFYETVAAMREVQRHEVDGFYHQWHPDDFEWKNRFGQPSPHEARKNAEETQLAIAATEIARTSAVGSTFILIDDAQFEGRLPSTLRIFPLVERDGVDWGLPADSSSAIAEVERLRNMGAESIAFVWTAFWWLDYYEEFREYLYARYRRVLDNERLLVFSLK